MTLRVVVAGDAVGELDPLRASVAMARGWAESAQVAVVPLTDGGPGLGAALAALLDGERETVEDGWRMHAGDTLAVGTARLPDALVAPPGVNRLIVDLTEMDGTDAGPETLLATRERLAGVELVGVVPSEQAEWKLLGLQGAVVRRGYEDGRDTAAILAEETAMARRLGELGIADSPGAGAAGGAATVVLALGGRIVGGTALCAELAGLGRTIAAADVVVTGCTSFDIGSRGGSAVGYVADAATAAERPCLVFALESSVSRREMRTFGVEAAYAVGPGRLPDALTAAVRRVAEGWAPTQPE